MAGQKKKMMVGGQKNMDGWMDENSMKKIDGWLNGQKKNV